MAEINKPTLIIDGKEIVLQISDGSLLSKLLIFERPELFERCPPEIQEAIKYVHYAITLQSHVRYEESLIYIDMAFRAISHSTSPIDMSSQF